jgi:hypothetical protein
MDSEDVRLVSKWTARHCREKDAAPPLTFILRWLFTR